MKSKQLGLSPIGVLAMTCLFALAVILALKLTTHYIDYYSIKGIYERLLKDPEIKEMDAGDILRKIEGRTYISGLRDYDVKKNSFVGEDDDGEMVLEFNYEVREHILGNLDVILTFSYSSNPEAIVTEDE
ncbi:MAG: DUF4845 domain-containing protein [Pseudomonadales bacterium]|nr:DUF4845 domain-containing protein [Pseudomonadales bacterium]